MSSAAVWGELWGQAPSDWAFIQEQKHNPLFEAMLDATNVGETAHFFDAGCGGGSACALAAQRGAQVSGLDAAEGLVEIARKRTPSGDFRVGDMEKLPFEDDAFDVVFAVNSIQYPTNRLAALQELKRVCSPKGQIAIGLFGSPERVRFRVMQQTVRSTLPTPPAGQGPYELSAPGKLEELLADAGLQITQSDEIDCPYIYPDFETYWRGQTSAGPTQRVLRTVGEGKLKAVLQEALEAFRTDDGSFYIGPNIFKYVVTTSTA